MEKKYYDLIVSLIKQHRKYSECEAILEDIANDVYEHSKVVMSSVSNEDVLTVYLTKVIATSMITVPKKLNFNTKARHRVILPNSPENKTVEVIEPIKSEQSVQQDVISANVDLVENVTSEPEIVNKEELVIDDFESETLDFSEINENQIIEEDDSLNQLDLASDDEIAVTENSDSELELEEDLTSEELVDVQEELPDDSGEQMSVQDVDKNLVDMMINGVPGLEESTNEEELVELEDESPEEDSESLDVIESVNEQNDDVLSTDSLMEEESLELADTQELPMEELNEDDTFESVDLVVEADSSQAVEELNENTSLEDSQDFDAESESSIVLDLENNESSFDIEEIAESIETEPLSEIEPLEESYEVLEESESSFDLVTNNESDLELVEEVLGEPEDGIEELTESLDNEVEEFSAPCYDCFSYEPDKKEYDAEEIMSYLEDINEKHPERQILLICDLKYKQNLSVQEISDKTGFSTDKVIDVLNEIIDTVKD